MTVAELITALYNLGPDAQGLTVRSNSGWECGQTQIERIERKPDDYDRTQTVIELGQA